MSHTRSQRPFVFAALASRSNREARASKGHHVRHRKGLGTGIPGTLDPMARPSIGTGKYSVANDVKSADIK